MQPQLTAQQQITTQALKGMQEEVGGLVWKVRMLGAEVEILRAENAALKAQHEPQAGEPTPMKARKNGAGVIDQAIDAVKAAETSGG